MIVCILYTLSLSLSFSPSPPLSLSPPPPLSLLSPPLSLLFYQRQSSAITRKLDKIHTLLLKNADEVLCEKLKELCIPSQTYGM